MFTVNCTNHKFVADNGEILDTSQHDLHDNKKAYDSEATDGPVHLVAVHREVERALLSLWILELGSKHLCVTHFCSSGQCCALPSQKCYKIPKAGCPPSNANVGAPAGPTPVPAGDPCRVLGDGPNVPCAPGTACTYCIWPGVRHSCHIGAQSCKCYTIGAKC